MNILEALKKYIRTNGGSSRANNISEAVKDLDSIPQGSGGGGMVVNFNLQISGDEAIVSADKTPAEVIVAAVTGPVMGTLIAPDADVREITPIGSVAFLEPGFPAFWFRKIDDDGHMRYFITTDEGNWVIDFI